MFLFFLTGKNTINFIYY